MNNTRTKIAGWVFIIAAIAGCLIGLADKAFKAITGASFMGIGAVDWAVMTFQAATLLVAGYAFICVTFLFGGA